MAPDHVVHVGTASKTLGPALRLAWMVLPERLVGPVTDAKRHLDLHSETISQLTLADLITCNGYDLHIRTCRRRYRQRRKLLLDRLRPLPHIAVDGIAAGLHALIWLTAPGVTERDVLARAEQHDLKIAGLDDHWHGPGGHRPGLIVGYGTPRESRYAAAVDALTRVLGGGVTPARQRTSR